MRMNEGVEWAAHCAVVLAALPPEGALPAAKLAEYFDLAPPYLSKTMQQLSRAGIVTSAQGRRGGYRLAREAEAITLLDIVEAVDGEDRAFRCTEIRRRGPAAVPARRYSPRCGIAAAMWQAEDAYRRSLASVSIADIAAGVLEQAPPLALARTEAWLAAALER